MTFDEWWIRNACKDILHCEKCKLVTNCETVEILCRDAWQAAQKEHEKLVNPLTTDNPDFDKAWNNDRLLQRLDDSESKMSIGEYAKYWFQKGQEVAYPKWTYCKDGMPKESDGKFEGTGIFNSSVFNVLHSNGTVASMYYYKKLKAFGTSDGVKVYSCNDIIAWMPLPEVPND